MKRKKWIVYGLFWAVSPYILADVVPLTLDKVSFQISAKRWVDTQTVMLSVGINATLDSLDLVKARASMMTKLSKIVSGDWHMVQFDRYQDNSGMQKLDAMAQVRVNQSQLNRVYDTVKEISRAGETFTVASIEFKPGLEEIQKTKAELRQQLNKEVQQELAVLNRTFTEQHFTLSALDYLDDVGPGPLQNRPLMLASNGGSRDAAASSAPITVSNELKMTAVVEAASVRKP